MNKLHYTDEEYYLTSAYLLKLAQNAGKLFESSEAPEKRQLLKLTLQNLELKGRKVRFIWQKPFDTIAFYASRQLWLAKWDDFRTFKLFEYIKQSELVLENSQQLLNL